MFSPEKLNNPCSFLIITEAHFVFPAALQEKTSVVVASAAEGVKRAREKIGHGTSEDLKLVDDDGDDDDDDYDERLLLVLLSWGGN